jgi:hypothetical protein
MGLRIVHKDPQSKGIQPLLDDLRTGEVLYAVHECHYPLGREEVAVAEPYVILARSLRVLISSGRMFAESNHSRHKRVERRQNKRASQCP